jgi:plastocyanin
MKTINVIIIVLVVVAVVLAVVYVMMRSNVMAPGSPSGGSTLSTSPSAQPQTGLPQTTVPQTTQPQPSNPAQPVAAGVTIQNFSFQPSPLTVSVGTTVTWTNMDSVPHQIKSTAFNSSPLSQGQTYSFTFQGAGTYDYSCAIHPTMHGQIIVQ